MQDKQDANPEFIINPVIPEYENKYFGDASHLNQSGSQKFTEEIKQKYLHLIDSEEYSVME